MPIYDFVCNKCGFKEEHIVSFNKRNKPKPCPKCKGEMFKEIGCPSFKFIGDGFYETDYKQTKRALKETENIKWGE